MDHQQATQLMAVERYLLDEMPPGLRDEFEEHYFDCQECAAGLRATQAFLDAAKAELRAHPLPASRPVSGPVRKSPFEFLFRPAFALPAFALLLLVIAWQGAVVYPRMASQLAALRVPRVLPTLSLVAGASRGGEVPSIALHPGQPFVINVDIPTQDRFSSYTCLLESPSGSPAFQIQVSAQQARDTVSISIPAGSAAPGNYNLTIRGNTGQAQPAVDLARHPFTVKIQD